MSTDAPWDGMSSLIQTFNPADGPPRMLERMVPFYETYIPIKCANDPVKLKAALAALAQRNTFLLEDIINPRLGESRMDFIRRHQAARRKG
jgi:hypothetical protein